MSQKWYVVKTKPRSEHLAAAELEKYGFRLFFPRLKSGRHGADATDLPLFPGYLFSRFTLRDQHMVLSAAGVATLVRLDGKPTPIRDSDIENVRRYVVALSAAGLEPDRTPYLSRGRRVLVKYGPFAGVEGIAGRDGRRQRVVVSLPGVRQSFAVTVDAQTVKLVRPIG